MKQLETKIFDKAAKGPALSLGKIDKYFTGEQKYYFLMKIR